ncbi:N-acetylglucosamine-6-phosphate deacetylase [Psychromonas ossibalaenae]|uniref:N-acetylglucosamine-6-phosphate deacetylase n=1 Tax=Psychromonas ossibalaenae TaxID=444922 RepID=UPI000381EAC3|nr:N-acetylglucosamine-6-phosphate deacetylase [Psychromonas ossibalaenae]
MPISTKKMLPAFALTNVDVFDGDKVLNNQVIVIEGQTIKSVAPMESVTSLPEIQIASPGLLATAGFIDLQLNGCGGVLLNSAIEEKTLTVMNHTNLISGTTQYLPTLVTSSQADLCKAVELVEGLKNPEEQGILGLHLEGPFINKKKKGAHAQQYIRELDTAAADYLTEHKSAVKVLTVAPECVSQEVINKLTSAGIIVSMGHTNATYEQLENKQGIVMATHLYNAMTPLTSREPGAVGYVLNHRPYSGIIVDGIHSDFAAVRLAHEHLGERLFMVTDAVTPAGTDLTEFDMAGTAAFVSQGKCHFADGTIAGASITMIKGIHNLIDKVGLSREEALRMASLYPAQAVNMAHQYGRIKAGYKANITLLNADNEVNSVYQMGRRFNP